MDTDIAGISRSAPVRLRLLERLRSGRAVAGHIVFAIVFACSAVAIGLYLYTAAHRMRFRFELEWMEGGILEHVKRVLAGKTVYPAPSVDFVPFIYNPLYYYVAAPFCAALGLEMFPLRLVSFLASVASFLLLFFLVRKHTDSLLAGVFATGFFAATFVPSGGWFDLARVDSLGLALVLASAFLLVGPNEQAPPARSRALIASGALAALAILTKQSAVLFTPVLLLRAFTSGRLRGAALFASALLLPLALAVLTLQIQSRGWYWYYVFQLPATHTMAGREGLVVDFWRSELVGALPIAATFGALELCSLPVTRAPRNWFAPVFAATLILVSYVTRLHMGSSTNDLMPAHAGLAILSANLLAKLARVWDTSTNCAPTWLVGALQISLLFYSPAAHLPPRGSRDAGLGIMGWLRLQPGEVWVVSHPYLDTLAGKPSHLHFMSLVDIELGSSDPRAVRSTLHQQINQALRRGRFSRIVMDDDWFFNSDALRDNYVLESSALVADAAALWPVTGSHRRPTLVYRKK